MTHTTMTLDTLETPAAVVDLDRLDRNLHRAADYASAHHLALRPHVKTHKSRRIASEQLRLGAQGLTCATPFEAEVMATVCDDLLLAYPPVGAARAARLAQLPNGVQVTVALDSERAIDDVGAAARASDRTIGAYVELDVGMRRVGVPAVEEALRLAKLIAQTRGLAWSGLAFYPGHVREPVADQDASLTQLAERLDDALQRFAAAGLTPPVVSGGSTPTLWRTHELPA